MVWPQTSVFHLWSWPHLLNQVCKCVQLLFEGGYYSECGFYSNKCSILHKGKSRWPSNTGPTIVATKINPTKVNVHYYWWCDVKLKIFTQKFEGFMPCLWYYKWTTCGHNKKMHVGKYWYKMCSVNIPLPLSPTRPYLRPVFSSSLVSARSSTPWKVREKLWMWTSRDEGWDARTPTKTKI